MRESIRFLPGEHDFAAFQASGGTAKTTIRNISHASLDVSVTDIILNFNANAFLYNMVRIIAGSIVDIGLAKLPPDAFRRAFESGNRLDLGMTAPPHGLELTKVFYPDAAFTNPASLRWHEED